MIRAQSALLPDPVFRVRQVVSNCTRLREVVVAATVRAPSVEVAAVREVVAAEAAGVDKDRNVWRSKK